MLYVFALQPQCHMSMLHVFACSHSVTYECCKPRSLLYLYNQSRGGRMTKTRPNGRAGQGIAEEKHSRGQQSGVRQASTGQMKTQHNKHRGNMEG